MEHAVETTRELYTSRGHTLHVALPPEPIAVEGDRLRLVQVLANLLTNAAKYSEPGGSVYLIVGREDGQAAIRVRDEGIGIGPDLLPRVFDLFTQGSHALDRSQGGLGVGLTLVKRMVELHGGTIEARSEGPGRGSEFILRLPTAQGPAGSESPDRTEVGEGTSGLRILLVEDNTDAADTLREILEAWGYTVTVCADGAAALATASADHPDVVLLDIGLPGMDGYEVARHMRENPDLARVPLLALTGYGQDRDRADSHAAGFNAHLVKPIDLPKLRALLQGVLPAA